MAKSKKQGRRYVFNAIVRRVVLDNVTVGLWAKNKGAAVEKATEFLEAFPGPTEVDGVDYGYIDNRETLENIVVELEPTEEH